MKFLSISLPRSWNELSNQQLYYLYRLHTENLSAETVKMLALLKWSRLKILHRVGDNYVVAVEKKKYVISVEKLAIASFELDWIDELPTIPVRISRIKGHDAVDAELQGVPFEVYLYCENLYQGYLRTQQHSLITEMGRKLYNCENMRFNQIERISIFYWWAAIKSYFSRAFPTFFIPVASEVSGVDIGRVLSDAMNSQIRALTKGDITKEREILSMDCWRALTELEAQAKEYEEFNRKYPGHGNT